jgi:hypothetical protein
MVNDPHVAWYEVTLATAAFFGGTVALWGLADAMMLLRVANWYQHNGKRRLLAWTSVVNHAWRTCLCGALFTVGFILMAQESYEQTPGWVTIKIILHLMALGAGGISLHGIWVSHRYRQMDDGED